MVVVLLAACSSDSSKPSASGSSQTQASTVTDPPPAGLPAFYGIPDPLPAGKPGDVIKTEPVTVPMLHGTMQRVMYHSQSIQGKDIPVTGLIAVPNTPPPAGGYPVISWAHGTTGIADECAPSLSPNDYVSIANGLLDAGYVVAGTDYEGLGTPGPPSVHRRPERRPRDARHRAARRATSPRCTRATATSCGVTPKEVTRRCSR